MQLLKRLHGLRGAFALHCIETGAIAQFESLSFLFQQQHGRETKPLQQSTALIADDDDDINLRPGAW